MELKNANQETHEEYYVYDFAMFFADFGGHVGLLLGYSLLTFYDQVKGIIIKMITANRVQGGVNKGCAPACLDGVKKLIE